MTVQKNKIKLDLFLIKKLRYKRNEIKFLILRTKKFLSKDYVQFTNT